MTHVGINNPNSHYNRNERAETLNALLAPAPVTAFTIPNYTEKIAKRHEAALKLISGGLTDKGERLATEYETQMTLLADYADKLVETGVS